MKHPRHLLVWALCLSLALVITSCTDDVSDLGKNNDTATGAETDSTAADSNSDSGNTEDTETTATQDSETTVDTETTTSEDTNPDADSVTETAADTGTASDTTPDGLFIQAECAIDNQLPGCTDIAGNYSAFPDDLGWGHDPDNDPKTYPTLSSDGQVGYTNGGSWFAFDALELTGYTKLTMRYSSQEDAEGTTTTGFRVRTDSVDGTEVVFVETHFTDSWTTYAEVTVDLAATVSGTHTVYFVAETDQINNGNVDWVHFHN